MEIYLGGIVIILTIVFAYLYLKYNYPETSENFSNSKNTKLGVETRHLEYAYRLCSRDHSPECRNYVNLFDELRKSFKKLKTYYCGLYPDKCKQLLEK